MAAEMMHGEIEIPEGHSHIAFADPGVGWSA